MGQEVDSNDRMITISHHLPEMKRKKGFIMFSVKIYRCKYVINDWNVQKKVLKHINYLFSDFRYKHD